MTDYGPLIMFLGGVGCGYLLDRFRLFLDRWSERHEEIEAGGRAEW